MKYAIVTISGKQFKVSVGDTITTERLDVKKGDNLSIKEVHLLRDNDATQIGKPYVKNSSVECLVADHIKGEKIRVSKFKAKVRYRKSMGFRPFQTILTIQSIIG